MKIHYVRHQVGGVLHEFPFAAPPSGEQLAALTKLCFQRHGEKHAKTGEVFWLKVVEVDVLAPTDVPVVPERSLSVVNEAGMPPPNVHATGHVENPKK